MVAREAMQKGAFDFLTKPATQKDLITAIRKVAQGRLLCPHVLAEQLDAYLKARAGAPSLNLDNLSKDFRISKSYIRRLFREHIGAPFRERLRHCRVDRAKRLLESTDDPINIIAGQCGFENPGRFAEAFRREEGMPPSKYRQICSGRRKK